tara:strand:- start:635 stop:919 length:285 start_codon:yes stop_codon:yes gene_type:complete
LVNKNELSAEQQKELSTLSARIKDDKTRIQEILQNVQIKNLPDVDEGKYDILIEEMVPPEALNFDKLTDAQKTSVVRNTKEKWCLVHNRMEETS